MSPYTECIRRFRSMSLKLENELLLRAAEITVAECSEEELMQALRYAWGLVLHERERHEAFATDLLGVPVVCGGPLLPQRLQTKVN